MSEASNIVDQGTGSELTICMMAYQISVEFCAQLAVLPCTLSFCGFVKYCLPCSAIYS